MNLRLFSVTLAAPACLFAAESEEPKPKVTQESLAVLRETFTYQPSIRQEAERKKEAGGEIVKMERFVVIESLRQKGLDAKMAREVRKKAEEEFTPLKGGTIIGNDRVKIGTWPDPDGHPAGIKFLKMKF